MHLKEYIGILHDSELQLADSFTFMAARHERDAEIRDMAREMAEWSRRRVEAIKHLAERFGESRSADPEKLRSALFGGTRIGGFGLLRDLQDLGLMAHQVHLSWVALRQAASEMHEKELEDRLTAFGDETHRQIEWINTQLKMASPQAIAGTANKVSELKASMPKHPSAAAVPDPVWAPATGAVLLLTVGAVSLIVGKPMLFPSLGPTAYLLAEMPAHPSSRWYNVIVGHLIGILAAVAAIAIFSAWNDPQMIQTGILTEGRMWASVIALLLTILFGILLKASHPPAAATTLLVSLGGISTIDQAIMLMIGVLILGILGEGVRRIRLAQWLSRSGEQPRRPMDPAYGFSGPHSEPKKL